MEVDIEEFQASYNALLQTFKELKGQEQFDEPRLKALNQQLNEIEKNNLDTSIKIKLMGAQLGGTEQSLREALGPEAKIKDDKIEDLAHKLQEKQNQFQRKTSQHQSIINNLKNKLAEKQSLYDHMNGEYSRLIDESSNRGNEQEEMLKLKDLASQRQVLVAELQQVDSTIADFQNSNKIVLQIGDSSLEEIERVQLELSSYSSQKAALQSHLRDTQKRKAEAVEKVRTEYQSQIASLTQQKHQVQTSLSRQNQEDEKFHKATISSLKEKADSLTKQLWSHQQLKKQVQTQTQSLADYHKQTETIRQQQIQSARQLDDEKVKLEAELGKLSATASHAKKSSDKVLEQIKEINQQLQAVKNKAKQTPKPDPRNIKRLKNQKEDFEKRVEKEKEKHRVLSQLQKTYHLQSELKEYKQKCASLRSQIDVLSASSRENKKLNDQVSDLKQKIKVIQEKEHIMVDVFSSEFNQVQTQVKGLQAQVNHYNKQLKSCTNKLNAYTQAYPDHEEKKLEEKKVQKKLEEEKIRQLKQKIKQQTQQKKVRKLSEEQELDSIIGTTPTPTATAKKDAKVLMVYGSGLILLLIIVYLFSRN